MNHEQAEAVILLRVHHEDVTFAQYLYWCFVGDCSSEEAVEKAVADANEYRASGLV